MKKSVAIGLIFLTILLTLVSCHPGKTLPPKTTKDPTVSDDFTIDTSPAPDPTPEKPKNGIKLSYRCDPCFGGTIHGGATQYIAKGGYANTVTAIPLYGYQFVCWSDGYTGRTRIADSVTKPTEYTAVFTELTVPAKITVPDIYINTSTGMPVNSQNYINGFISIKGAEDATHNIESMPLRIKGRGNSTWGSSYIGKEIGELRWSSTKKKYEQVGKLDVYSAKNSYSLKLSEGINMLGIGNGKNKDWVLNSNKFDITMLRNQVIWNIARKMGTLTWVPNCTWVNLYVNSEYRGLYMLTDKVEAAKDRVPVEDKGTNPDKGYLLELDMRADSDEGKREGIDYFYIPGFHETPDDENKREFDIKSDHSTKAECDFIKNYMIEVDAALRSGDRKRIEELVDIYSLVDIFILEELSKDCDMGATSFYMHKEKGGKLYFVAPWDFDLCMGNYSMGIEETGLVSEEPYGNEWFEAVHNLDWFKQMVRGRFRSIENDFDEAMAEMYRLALALKPYADRNNELFGIYGENYHEYVSPQVGGLVATYDEHVAFVHDWLYYRMVELRYYYPERESPSSPLNKNEKTMEAETEAPLKQS